MSTNIYVGNRPVSATECDTRESKGLFRVTLDNNVEMLAKVCVPCVAMGCVWRQAPAPVWACRSKGSSGTVQR
jgi:hypothetical protein